MYIFVLLNSRLQNAQACYCIRNIIFIVERKNNNIQLSGLSVIINNVIDIIYPYLIHLSILSIHGEFTLSTKIYHNNPNLPQQHFSLNKGKTTRYEMVLQCSMMVHVTTKLMGYVLYQATICRRSKGHRNYVTHALHDASLNYLLSFLQNPLVMHYLLPRCNIIRNTSLRDELSKSRNMDWWHNVSFLWIPLSIMLDNEQNMKEKTSILFRMCYGYKVVDTNQKSTNTRARLILKSSTFSPVSK